MLSRHKLFPVHLLSVKPGKAKGYINKAKTRPVQGAGLRFMSYFGFAGAFLNGRWDFSRAEVLDCSSA